MSPCVGEDVRQDVIADLKLAQASCRSDIDDLQARFWELQKQLRGAISKLQEDESLVSTARGASGKESECSGDPSSGIQSKLASKSSCLPPDEHGGSERFGPTGSASSSRDQEGIGHTTATGSFASSPGYESVEESVLLTTESPVAAAPVADRPQGLAVPRNTPPLDSASASASACASASQAPQPVSLQTRLRLPAQSLAPTGAARQCSGEGSSSGTQASDNKLASREELEALQQRLADMESRQAEYVEKLDAALDAARTGIFKLARELHRDQEARKRVFTELKTTGVELGKSCVKPELQSAKDDLRANMQTLLKQEAAKLQIALDTRWQLLLAELRATSTTSTPVAVATAAAAAAPQSTPKVSAAAPAASASLPTLPVTLMNVSASTNSITTKERTNQEGTTAAAAKASVSPIGQMLEQLEELEEVDERSEEQRRLQLEQRRRQKSLQKQRTSQNQEKEESAPPEVVWHLKDWLPSNVDGGEEATKQMLLQVGASAELSNSLGNISLEMLVSRPTARLLYRVALAMQSVTGFPTKLPALWPENSIDKLRFIQQLWKEVADALQLKDFDCRADEVMRCTNRTHTRRMMQLLTIAAVKERCRVGAQCAEEACRLQTPDDEDCCSLVPSAHSSPAATSRDRPGELRPDEVVVPSLGIVKLHSGLACRPASALQKRCEKTPGKTLLRAMSAGRLQTKSKSKSLNRLWEALEAAGEASKADAGSEALQKEDKRHRTLTQL